MLQQILRYEIIKISALFIVWRTTLLLFGFLALALLPKIKAGELVFNSINFWQSWANWDGGHFLGIAENGFKFTQQYAFFPLFPAIIALLTPVFFNSSLVAGLVIANFAALFATIFFFQLLRLDFDKDFSLRTLSYFLFFPTAFFLGTVYSEPVFLASTIPAFYFARKKKFLKASILAFLATLTKPYGVLITLPLLMEYFDQKKFRLKLEPQVFFLLIPVVAFILYLIYLKNITGDPFIFIKVQENWARAAANPAATFWIYYVSFFVTPVNLFFGVKLVEFVSAVFVLILAVTNWRRLRFSYLTYLILFFLVFISTGNLASFPRFILVLWPIFLIMASWGDNFLFDFFYKLVSLILLGLFTGLFLSGFFIA